MMAVKVFLVVLLMIAEEKMNRKMMCSFWCSVLGSSILKLVPIFALRFIFKLQSGESPVPCMIMAISVFNINDDDDGFKSVLFKVLFSLFF